MGRSACVDITSGVILFTLLVQAFFSTKAQECILEKVIEILLFKAEEVTVRNGRIIVDLAFQ